MTGFSNIHRATIEFTNRDGVPTALIIDGTVPEADLMAGVNVDEDGLTASVELSGIVPNGTGYAFKGLEDWELRWVRRGEMPTRLPERQPVGPVARWTMGVVALAILAPFVAILWAWAGQVFRSFS